MKSETFGRYELLAELGSGGMATLLLARLVGPSDFQKFLVVKRIHERLTRDATVVNRFLDEARLAAMIQHPNVVQIFEFDQVDDAYFIAMEYVHGQTAAELLERVTEGKSDSLQWSHAVRIVADAAAGLEAAHELVGADGLPLNLVHRDVSPQNILISFDGNVKIADFGIAHAVGRIHQTQDGTIIGKVGYMSPEQCLGQPVDRRTDVFALGIVLYEMACKRALFRSEGAMETQERVLRCEIPLPSTVAPDIPVDLEQLLLKALAPQPEHRFATAGELSAALEELLRARSQAVTSPHLARLMGKVFRKEMRAKDRMIRALYQKTFLDKEEGGADGSGSESRDPVEFSSAGLPRGKARLDPEVVEATLRGPSPRDPGVAVTPEDPGSGTTRAVSPGVKKGEVGFVVGGIPSRPPPRQTEALYPLAELDESERTAEVETDEVATRELRNSARVRDQASNPAAEDQASAETTDAEDE